MTRKYARSILSQDSGSFTIAIAGYLIWTSLWHWSIQHCRLRSHDGSLTEVQASLITSTNAALLNSGRVACHHTRRKASISSTNDMQYGGLTSFGQARSTPRKSVEEGRTEGISLKPCVVWHGACLPSSRRTRRPEKSWEGNVQLISHRQ